jgi:hypothetical protein
LLGKVKFVKVPVEGPDKDKLQYIDDIPMSAVSVAGDGAGGVSVGITFMIANAPGSPKVITDGGEEKLVIFDGAANEYLRDPVLMFRETEGTPPPPNGGGGGGCDAGFGMGLAVLAGLIAYRKKK